MLFQRKDKFRRAGNGRFLTVKMGKYRDWETARTPRNVFGDSLDSIVIEVELLIGLGGFTAYQTQINSECY